MGWAGYARLYHEIFNDSASEEVTLNEAHDFVEGHQKYGIVGLTHYPNGPMYVVAAAYELGITDLHTIRIIPLTLSVTCICILLFVLLGYCSNLHIAGWLLFSSFVYFFQPSILWWHQAIHQHSYQMSLFFLSMAIGLSRKNVLLPFLAIGFLQGWIGYDFLPPSWVGIVLGRVLYHGVLKKEGTKKAFWLAAVDTAACIAGSLIAFAMHFVQDALYFGGIKPAFDDLAGSALSRVDPSLGKGLDPAYANHLEAAMNFKKHPPIPALVIDEYIEFFRNGWIRTWFFYPGVLISGLIWFWPRLFGSRNLSLPLPANARRLGWVVFWLSWLGPPTWTVLMPTHAWCHPHFLPRHCLIVLLFWLIIPVILTSTENRSVASS